MMMNTLKKIWSSAILFLAFSFLISGSLSSCTNQTADQETTEEQAGDAEQSEHPEGEAESDEHPNDGEEDEHPL